MKVGSYNLRLLDCGRFRLDGGAMFGVVPKVLWEKKKPADEKNRIQMATNVLLIEGEGRKILVDVGIGTKFDEKFQQIYAVDYNQHSLEKSLKEAGLETTDITDVVLTHLHFDHAGGSTYRNERDQVLPTFPNATYYVQKGQFDWAHRRNEKDRASYFNENYDPLQEAGILKLLNGSMELFPGIEVITVDGHTPQQQMVFIRGEEYPVLFAADLIPLYPHVSIPWVMAYDLYPLKTIEEKKSILQRAVVENWILIFEHDPEVTAGTVVKTEKGFAAGESVDLNAN